MAEQKKNSPSEENRPKCRHCKRVASEMRQYIEMLDRQGLEECYNKKLAEYLGFCAVDSCKTDDSAGCSAVPKAEVKKCEEKPIGIDKILQSEEAEKCVGRMQSLSISMKRDSLQSEEAEKCVDGMQSLSIAIKRESLQNQENMKKLLEMLKKYPQMVATQSEADLGGDFYIYCTECPASFNVVELAEQHFEEKMHDKKSL